MIAQPNESLLPAATRHILRQYLQSQGVATPKVALMVRQLGAGRGASQDLVFNLTPPQFDSEQTYRGVLQRLGWFLPRHYSCVGMPEDSLSGGFIPL